MIEMLFYVNESALVFKCSEVRLRHTNTTVSLLNTEKRCITPCLLNRVVQIRIDIENITCIVA